MKLSSFLVFVLVSEVAGFAPPQRYSNWKSRNSLDGRHSSTLSFWKPTPKVVTTPPFTTTTSLGLFDLFRRKKDTDKEADNDEETGKTTTVADQQESDTVQDKGKTPFFATEEQQDNAATADTTSAATVKEEEETPPQQQQDEEKMSPLQEAQSLKAQAERMRLEAEKMDAQLTLEKIERLEKQLATAKKLHPDQPDKTIELQAEMDALQAKIRGEKPKAAVVASKPSKTTTSSSSSSPPTTSSNLLLEPKQTYSGILSEIEDGLAPFNQSQFEEHLQTYNEVPGFMKGVLANMVGVDHDDIKDVNATEVCMRWERVDRKDYTWMDVEKPTLTKQAIEARKKVLQQVEFMGDEIISKYANGNVTAMAVMMLEDEYYSAMMGADGVDRTIGLGGMLDDDWKRSFQEGLEDGGIMSTSTAEGLFPKSTRKEGQTPTDAQVNLLAAQVLPQANFAPSSKPERVVGGYVIRGQNKNKKKDGSSDADALMEEIEKGMAKSAVADKLSVFYIKDFTVYENEDVDDDIMNSPPILYVMGPDVARTSRPLLFSLVSALGLGTSWYLSVYPFLLNLNIEKRVEEQLALANAGMTYDLDWLTGAASPLFLSFLAILLAHEAGHFAVAALYGTRLTVPTFVPSLITGVTSTVTSFKEPPKNHKAMFDFALAGPTLGLIASLGALFVGLQMTAYTDPQTYAEFPALPLQVLRQSTLGGGIIELVLGSGALGVPDSETAAQAIASINIPLHPIAIAGYIGLMVNALSLLPVGTTDGGRIALTMFGRGVKLVIGQGLLIALFFLGLFGSDLFLFYFSFLIFFQNGNEIPSRNEADEVDFGRVLLATAAGVVTLLTLVPMG